MFTHNYPIIEYLRIALEVVQLPKRHIAAILFTGVSSIFNGHVDARLFVV